MVRVFLGTRDLVNYNHLRLGFLSENVWPSAEKGPRKCRVCSIRIHWHSSGPCCWRRRDLSKILLLSRRWNAFGLTKCSILFTLQPIAHILRIVLTVAIVFICIFPWPAGEQSPRDGQRHETADRQAFQWFFVLSVYFLPFARRRVGIIFLTAARDRTTSKRNKDGNTLAMVAWHKNHAAILCQACE